jgi:DNA-binding transcriptional regulator YiaG
MQDHGSLEASIMDDHRRYEGIDLKLLRIRAGLRQYRVAQELGIPPSLLCDWENGRRPVPSRQGQRILSAIDRLALMPGGQPSNGSS